jgi:hypothetical protein
MMSSDPIVAEIRQIREEIAAGFDYDTGAILKYAQARDALGDRKIIRLPPRRPVAPAKTKPRQQPEAAVDRQ